MIESSHTTYSYITKNPTKKLSNFCRELPLIAGVEGIEPSSGVLETLILPMNYTPIVKRTLEDSNPRPSGP